MTEREEYMEQCKTQWFKDHKHTLDATGGAQVLRWAKPGTGVYAVTYLLFLNRLIVVGDLGSSVFCWSEKLTWDFLGGLNFGYFMSKCEASSKGREGKEWDEDQAKRWLDNCLDNLAAIRLDEKNMNDNPKSRAYMIKQIRKEWNELDSYKNPYECCADQHEWYRFLIDDGAEILGGEAWENASIGMATCYELLGQFVGLKMACEKLKEAEACVMASTSST